MFVESLWLSVTLGVLSELSGVDGLHPRSHFGILLQWIGVNSLGSFSFPESEWISISGLKQAPMGTLCYPVLLFTGHL